MKDNHEKNKFPLLPYISLLSNYWTIEFLVFNCLEKGKSEKRERKSNPYSINYTCSTYFFLLITIKLVYNIYIYI